MDDLQFRRIIYGDPNCMDADVLQAKKDDPSKQQFAHEIDHLEQKINTALKVNVPDELANRLILQQVLASHQQQKRKSRIQLALAASVAFVVGLSVNQFKSAPAYAVPTYATIGEYALAHTHNEEHMFQNNMLANMSLASLNQKIQPFGGHFNQSIGNLISAGYCDFGNIKALHLEYQGLHKPVTVFVIPNDNPLTMQASFADAKLHGSAEKFKHADVLIVADKQEPLGKWQQTVKNNITWSI